MTENGALAARIARTIEAQGPISIAQFITIALHDPRDGYYATRIPLGADFITAPEISQAFGELLGLWCADVWHDQGKPKPARLVELGPGRGTLMADALRAARLVPEFLGAIEVVLVETSPVLTAVQQNTLRGCGVPLRWVGSAADLGQDRPQFTIANEFLDALPIRQFVMTGQGWRERMVGVDRAGALTFLLMPAAWNFAVPPQRGEAAEGAVYEFSPAATALVGDLAQGVARVGGAALFIDYGYAEAGFGDTLQAVADNRYRTILDAPGAVDLSAHVDFAAMARAAHAGGALAYGPVCQGQFLERLGIRSREKRLRMGPNADCAAAGIDRLTRSDAMGTLFQALAILPASAPSPAGFA